MARLGWVPLTHPWSNVLFKAGSSFAKGCRRVDIGFIGLPVSAWYHFRQAPAAIR